MSPTITISKEQLTDAVEASVREVLSASPYENIKALAPNAAWLSWDRLKYVPAPRSPSDFLPAVDDLINRSALAERSVDSAAFANAALTIANALRVMGEAPGRPSPPRAWQDTDLWGVMDHHGDVLNIPAANLIALGWTPPK